MNPLDTGRVCVAGAVLLLVSIAAPGREAEAKKGTGSAAQRRCLSPFFAAERNPTDSAPTDVSFLAPEGEPTTSPSTAPKTLHLDLGDNVRMKLVRIPAGKFMMGSPPKARYRPQRNERPQREITIRREFYLGACEVTRGQFAAFIEATRRKTDAERLGEAYAWDGRKWDKVKGASWRKPGFEQTDEHPVICVSWTDATNFCDWLGTKTGRSVRLPTEAEWEYACRAGSKTAFWWSDDDAGGQGACNAADRTAKKRFKGWAVFDWEDGYVFTSPAGKYKPNAFGLHDMLGNVWEWCSDTYVEKPGRRSARDAYAKEGNRRVVRGGSWMSPPNRCRSAFRGACGLQGFYCDFIIGFRVAVDLDPPGDKRTTRPADQAACENERAGGRDAEATTGLVPVEM
jgi:sulfatase modifying factor 1